MAMRCTCLTMARAGEAMIRNITAILESLIAAIEMGTADSRARVELQSLSDSVMKKIKKNIFERYLNT